MASLRETLFGKKGGFEQVDFLTPQQRSLFGQLIQGLPMGQGLDAIKSMLGGSQDFLNQLQAPALRRFQEQTIPNIAERFTGAGSQGSSAFQQSLGSAGAKLTEDLAGQRAALGMESQQQGLLQLLQLLGLAQKPQFMPAYREGTGGALPGLLSAAGTAAGTAIGGPLGGAIGSGAGQGLSAIFKKLFGQKDTLEQGNYGLYPTTGFETLTS